jgi:hypothetical protein
MRHYLKINNWNKNFKNQYTHTHTHTHDLEYINSYKWATRKQKKKSQNWAKKFNGYFSNKDKWMTNMHMKSCTWWCMLVIQALGRLRQENHKSETSLGYIARLRQNQHSIEKNKARKWFFVCVCVSVLGLQLKTSHLSLARQVLYHLSHQPFFVLHIFKIGSPELFAWAVLEPPSSLSLPP